MNFVSAAGLFAWPLILLTLLLVGLVVHAIRRLSNGEDPRRESILFWGFTAAIFGFLGQCNALYRALIVISTAPAIDPGITGAGFAESFTSTLWGGALLVAAVLAWFILRPADSRSDT